MEFPYFALIALAAGSFFLLRAIVFLTNPEKLKSYLETSPKAAFSQNKFGPERTLQLAKTVFMPLAIIISLFLISVGAYAILLYFRFVPNLFAGII